MDKPEHCAKEEALVPAVDAGGLEEIRITQRAENGFVLSVKIKTKSDWYFLATRREPGQPREFKKMDAAVSAGQKLFGAKRFTLVLL
jgi:hypothetical protein